MIKIFFVAMAMMLATGFLVNTQNNEDKTSGGTPFDESAERMDITLEENEKEEVVKYEKPVVNSNKVLDLSGQGLKKTPAYIFNEISIQELDLSNNKLEGSLQAEVRHLQNLKILDLSNNQFTGVPAEVGQLKNLEILDLSNNQLTGLPYELGNLSNLKILNLKGNVYSPTDLSIIKQSLSASTIVQVD